MLIGFDIGLDIHHLERFRMSSLKVSYHKLEKYTKEHGSYELSSDGTDVVLVFVPTHQEVLEKGDSDSPPRVILRGRISNGIVEFQRVEIEDQNGTHEKDMRDAEMTYSSWLDYVEENY